MSRLILSNGFSVVEVIFMDGMVSFLEIFIEFTGFVILDKGLNIPFHFVSFEIQFNFIVGFMVSVVICIGWGMKIIKIKNFEEGIPISL